MSEDAAPRHQLRTLGELIRQQRQQAELTLRDLAARANVSNPYLSQIERGLHEPSVRVLKAIAGALNLSAETLLQQAGILEGDGGDEAPRPSVEEAVRADPRLTPKQREALLAVYRGFVESAEADERRGEPAGRPAAPPGATRARRRRS